MIKKTRRKFSGEFKAKVVIETLKERQTIPVLAQKFELHPHQINAWKKEFIEKAALIFSSPKDKEATVSEADLQKLYAKIGQLEMEKDFLKKASSILKA